MQARRQWAWLILLARWGFPVTDSPMGRAIKHARLGNEAVVGSAYHADWNRLGETPASLVYDPHMLISQFQTGLQDNFRPSWGFLNLTLPTLAALPVTNVLWSMAAHRFVHRPKFYPADELPFRFYSLGWSPPLFTTADHAFARLLPREGDPFIAQLLSDNPGAQIDVESGRFLPKTSLLGFMYNQHIGRFTSENSVSRSDGDVKYEILANDGRTLGEVRGDVELWDLGGSLRANLRKGALQPFAYAGYGWSWYRVRNMTLNGKGLSQNRTEWYHNPKWPPDVWYDLLPNTFHAGLGVEWFLTRNRGVWSVPYLAGTVFDKYTGAPDLALRLDLTYYGHRLGGDVPDNRDDARVSRRTIRLGLIIGL